MRAAPTGHPENAGLLAHLRRRDGPTGHPDGIDDPYRSLGTHPELVERLWDRLGGTLPEDCRWVERGAPVLRHPRSGLFFGYAGGTQVYALRLPPLALAEARARNAPRVHTYMDGSRLDLDAFGPAWVFGQWEDEEEAWCREAGLYAAPDEASALPCPRCGGRAFYAEAEDGAMPFFHVLAWGQLRPTSPRHLPPPLTRDLPLYCGSCSWDGSYDRLRDETPPSRS